MKPLSILEVCLSRSWGGLEIYAASVAGWLQEQGHEVAAMTLSDSPIEENCRRNGIQVFEAARAGYVSPSAVMAVIRAIQRSQPDVIHAHLAKDLWVIALALLFVRKVPVVFSQQMASDYPKRDILHRWVWGKVSQVAALTEEIRDKTLRNATIGEDRICILPYGIDAEKLAPSQDMRSELREQYGIGDDQVAIGVVGRLDPGKGQQVFLEALARLVDRHNILGLLIGEETRGEPGFRQVLENRVRELNLQDRVRFLGFIADPVQCYPMLDVLVLPSRKETFGLVLIEAMAFGLPVVATDAGGVPEIVIDGETGILVPPEDPESLAQAIIVMVSDRDRMAEMGRKGRQRVFERYRLSTHLDKLESLFYKVAGKASGTD